MIAYDHECYELARRFAGGQTAEHLVRDLARHIQAAIKDYLQNVEFEEDAARQDAADRASGI